MTTGLWNASISESPGAVTPPADLDRYTIVLGCTSGGVAGRIYGPYANARSMVTAVGYGDTVDTAGQIAEQRQTNQTKVASVPVAIYKLASTNPGTYGAIDTTGITGTCLPVVASSAPYITCRAAIKIVNGGIVGTDGITYRESLEQDPDWSSIAAKRLGTATSIALAQSNAGFVLQPASSTLTALYTKTTLLQTTLTGTGHFTITSGGTPVHAAADTAGDTALAAVPAATTPATCVTLFNAIKTYLATHGASAVFHAGADATLGTALSAIPTAVNVADVDLYLDNLIAAYEAHRVNVTSVHGSADSTNTITAYTSIPGTLVAGDIFFAPTFAPTPSASDIDAAYVALSKSGKLFGLAVHEFPMTPGLIDNVSNGLTVCENLNRRMVALARTRVRDLEAGETEEEWKDAIELDFPVGTVDDARISLFSSYAYETDARTLNVYLRSGFAQYCTDVVRVPINLPPCAPADQPATGLTIWTNADVQVGHDEGGRGDVTGLSNADLGNRFVSTVSGEDPLRGNTVHFTFPWVLAGADEDIKSLMQRRIATSMERVAISAVIDAGGITLDYDAPPEDNPSVGYLLTSTSRDALHGVIFNALSARFAPFIQNADDADIETGLVWINPSITVSSGKRVAVEYMIRMRNQGILTTSVGVLKVQE